MCQYGGDGDDDVRSSSVLYAPSGERIPPRHSAKCIAAAADMNQQKDSLLLLGQASPRGPLGQHGQARANPHNSKPTLAVMTATLSARSDWGVGWWWVGGRGRESR